MPHLSIEYSKNIESKIDLSKVLKSVHLSLEQCPEIDLSRLKSRLVPHEAVICGARAVSIEMIHVTLAVLSGRNIEMRRTFGKAIFECLQEQTAGYGADQAQGALSLTVEIREMERDCYFR